jgi:hypothetical protein
MMPVAWLGDNRDCGALTSEVVSQYARGVLNRIAVLSVEDHLSTCETCRQRLAEEFDQSRLRQNRSMVLLRLALPSAGLLERAAIRCGAPAHLWRLLSVTPSLRRSWLTGILLVLGAAIGMSHMVTGRSAVAILPFLMLAPLLPLAGVATAFHPRLDPAAVLATTAPVSGVWLFCVRAVAVIAAALAPIVIAAFAMPGNFLWLPPLVILPAIAVSAAALALMTVTSPVVAAVSAGAVWMGVVATVGLITSSPVPAYGGSGQAMSVVVLLVASCLLVARRHVLEFGWNR